MGRLVFGMNMSLDGFVDHDRFGPGDRLFRHFIDQARALSGSVYGRRLYELMRYWDDDQSDWDEPLREFAEAWRAQPKWVVSGSLTEVGPNATLVDGDLDEVDALVRRLRDELEGRIDVGGTRLAASLAERDLIDEYQIYLHPVVLGEGTPYFAGARPDLRLIGSDVVDGQVVQLRYEPAEKRSE
ncbi:dihydrofolate reductase family protein [Nocardioides sp. GXZ039]|uniref:dihydrofolate reductase family protein n=1 Tax=Nocardioides sp. GXZ039 TaxID=3136018 RepID=UPI0030F3EEF7